MRRKFVKSFIKNNLKFYISLVLCSAICFSSFVTFNHLLESITDGLNNYIKDYEYTDGLIDLNTDYTEEELEAFSNLKGINKYYKSHYAEFISGDYATIRLNKINIKNFPMYVVSEVDDGDIYLSVDYAKANNIEAGDYINFTIDNEKVPVKVKALVNSPFLLGLARNNLSMLETSTYGMAAIDSYSTNPLIDKLDKVSLSYYLDDLDDSEEVLNEVQNIFKDKIKYAASNKERLAIKSIENDINVLKPIATILPIIIYIIGLIISMLFIKQFIDTKVREIGILKSIGQDNKYIISIFVLYVLSITIFSFILGLILSIIQIRLYVNLYTNAINLPLFHVKNNYLIILMAFIITLITNLFAVIINIKSIVKVDVVNVINNIKSNKSSRTKLLRNKFIKIKPFISSILNNPFRFVFSILNLVFIVIIVTSSITVKYAKDDSINYVNNNQNNYDYIVHLNENVINNESNYFYEDIGIIDNKNSIYYVDLTVLNNFDYLNMYDLNNNKLSLYDDGVIISEKDSNNLNVKVGDYITLNEKEVKVSAISKQTYNFRVIMSYKLFNEIYGYNISNSIFMNEDDSINLDNVSYISSNEIMKKDMNNKLKYIDNYIIIIIGVVILISIVVIFNISVIYYREKESSNKTLRTIGYSKSRIIFYSTIELIIESIIALIIGIPLGYNLSLYVTNKISTDYIIIYNDFSNVHILEISLFIIITSVIGRIIASRNKIKLVD